MTLQLLLFFPTSEPCPVCLGSLRVLELLGDVFEPCWCCAGRGVP